MRTWVLAAILLAGCVGSSAQGQMPILADRTLAIQSYATVHASIRYHRYDVADWSWHSSGPVNVEVRAPMGYEFETGAKDHGSRNFTAQEDEGTIDFSWQNPGSSPITLVVLLQGTAVLVDAPS